MLFIKGSRMFGQAAIINYREAIIFKDLSKPHTIFKRYINNLANYFLKFRAMPNEEFRLGPSRSSPALLGLPLTLRRRYTSVS